MYPRWSCGPLWRMRVNPRETRGYCIQMGPFRTSPMQPSPCKSSIPSCSTIQASVPPISASMAARIPMVFATTWTISLPTRLRCCYPLVPRLPSTTRITAHPLFKPHRASRSRYLPRVVRDPLVPRVWSVKLPSSLIPSARHKRLPVAAREHWLHGVPWTRDRARAQPVSRI